MKKIMLISLIALLSFAGDLKFKNFGFEMDPLDVKYQNSMLILSQYMPVRHNFGSNINVMIQAYPDSLKSYHKLTLSELEKMGAKILEHKLEKDHLSYEYIVKNPQRVLHLYQKVYKKADIVYLITAASLEKSWNDDKKALKKSVDSFRLTK